MPDISVFRAQLQAAKSLEREWTRPFREMDTYLRAQARVHSGTLNVQVQLYHGTQSYPDYLSARLNNSEQAAEALIRSLPGCADPVL